MSRLPIVLACLAALCAPLPDLLKQLQIHFAEFVVMKGDAGTVGTVYVTRSNKGSWSVIFAHGNLGCLTAAGTTSVFDVGT